MVSRSNSLTSNTSETIQIFVNTSGGKSIKLNVRPDHSIANVLEFLSASTQLPLGSKLILAGKQLEPSSTVAELNLEESATLNLLTPSRGSQEPESSDTTAVNSTSSELKADSSAATSGTSTPTTASKPSTPRKSRKPRCTKEGCNAPAQPIVGDCGFCQKRFCGKHRMLESHNCSGLEDARQADKDRNAARLEQERTVMLRGL